MVLMVIMRIMIITVMVIDGIHVAYLLDFCIELLLLDFHQRRPLFVLLSLFRHGERTLGLLMKMFDRDVL
jgi:hypothetical protein